MVIDDLSQGCNSNSDPSRAREEPFQRAINTGPGRQRFVGGAKESEHKTRRMTDDTKDRNKTKIIAATAETQGPSRGRSSLKRLQPTRILFPVFSMVILWINFWVTFLQKVPINSMACIRYFLGSARAETCGYSRGIDNQFNKLKN